MNAPMAGHAGPGLATAVTLSGGFGLIGCELSASGIRSQLQQASETLRASSNPTIACAELLPVGIGLLPFALKLEEIAPVLEEAKPAVAWIFAAEDVNRYSEWATAIRKVSPGTKIWIQVGNVTTAVQIAKAASPDALCIQGADAGGHGYEKGASIVSLVPETLDTLAREGITNLPLLASGGIVDGRGVAAALSLGASGVVMGTRFLASKEVNIHPLYQASVLEARDGAQATVRSKLFDEARGPNPWPEVYDGRSLRTQSFQDYVEGSGIEDIRKLHAEAVSQEDKGFATGLKGRAAMWAGTGIGMVNEVEDAKDIVDRVRQEARNIFSYTATL
ncbi:inosine monophosphate dehydrogenase [Periconia macrospinosa]|uniref:Inosine monophosphate dehydrogenase n=1 Tax=Periconia macrospinosa TaxID=97972 RepID=A0A2V1DF00_9PLEO|nr:inosine monophosphate dehydrogenase [Periconia macrospinosa]